MDYYEMPPREQVTCHSPQELKIQRLMENGKMTAVVNRRHGKCAKAGINNNCR